MLMHLYTGVTFTKSYWFKITQEIMINQGSSPDIYWK